MNATSADEAVGLYVGVGFRSLARRVGIDLS